MNFANAKSVRHIMWCEGPLLSQVELGGKQYFVKWCDVNENVHTWLIFEVEPEIIGLYFNKLLTLRQIEERTPAAFVLEGFIDKNEAAWTDIADVPDDWLATTDSLYDKSLEQICFSHCCA